MSVIEQKALTQSVNYGQVALTQNQATQILAANSNRVKLYLNAVGSGTIVLGTDNSVTLNNGFPVGALTALVESGVDWQTAVYAYTNQPGVAVDYIEEVLS